MTKILVIDDEQRNIRLIKRYLCDTDYDIITAGDGIEGWALLQQERDSIDVILLDRMMPNMDGIEFMAKLKEDGDEDICNLPVIMQTAAAESGKIAEGIRAGVYYYLTKPFDQDVLLSVIHAALSDFSDYRTLQTQVKKYKRMLDLVENSRFSFKTLDDAIDLSTFIANLFPNPHNVILGISELFINAVEHGNLGITYDEKTKLMQEGTWKEEINKRLNLEEYINKYVKVDYTKSASDIILTIEDQGTGFDWKKYMEIDPARASDNHGRGIAMAKIISFDEIQYIGCGNKVVCKIFI